MAKRRYNSDDEESSEGSFDFDHISGNRKLLDKLDYEVNDHHDSLDREQSQDDDDSFDAGSERRMNDAFDDDFDVDKVKEQKKKKRIATIKPKLIGKHSLSYDTIFKGRKTEKNDDSSEHIIHNIGGSFELNEDSSEFNESRNSIENHINIKLQQEIYDLLKNNSDINFSAPRRKPSSEDFNSYYSIAIKQLESYGFSKCDIFIELSCYFSDNTFSIYSLLNNDYKKEIIIELKQKYGLSDIDKMNFFY